MPSLHFGTRAECYWFTSAPLLKNADWYLLIKIALRHSEKIHFLFSLLSYLFSGKVARGEVGEK